VESEVLRILQESCRRHDHLERDATFHVALSDGLWSTQQLLAKLPDRHPAFGGGIAYEE
jgi:hypothetical protein